MLYGAENRHGLLPWQLLSYFALQSLRYSIRVSPLDSIQNGEVWEKTQECWSAVILMLFHHSRPNRLII